MAAGKEGIAWHHYAPADFGLDNIDGLAQGWGRRHVQHRIAALQRNEAGERGMCGWDWGCILLMQASIAIRLCHLPGQHNSQSVCVLLLIGTACEW